MQTFFSRLNIVFFIELLFVTLIAVGIMPREGALFLAIFLPIIFIIWSLEESVYFVARSIPLFLALPITDSFDNFNIWRILILTLFIKLIFIQRYQIFDALKNIFIKTKTSTNDAFLFLKQNYKIELLSAALIFVSILSLAKAEDLGAGIKRIIYFVNLGMLFFVVRHIVNSNADIIKIGRNFIISGIIVAVIGILQLISAYFIHINKFAEFWAFVVERNLYGNAWAGIAISANTWFAYFNETIHLRMFSSFPDSHTFPVYLLTVSIFVTTLIAFKKTSFNHTCKPALILLFTFSLCIVLSGTRGIWAAAPIPLFILIFYFFRKTESRKNIFLLGLPIVFFIIALLISQPIFSSKQFRLSENQSDSADKVLVSRLVSIFDTEETSNQGRIYIWQESIRSIIQNPLLGVGIGNFPTVLKQDIQLAKAGSSAHNLFLQILAEMGIVAFAIFLFIVYEIYKKSLALSKNQDQLLKFFGHFSLLYFTWILTYTMTDPAIFDERAFLGLMIPIGAIFGLINNK